MERIVTTFHNYLNKYNGMFFGRFGYLESRRFVSIVRWFFLDSKRSIWNLLKSVFMKIRFHPWLEMTKFSRNLSYVVDVVEFLKYSKRPNSDYRNYSVLSLSRMFVILFYKTPPMGQFIISWDCQLETFVMNLWYVWTDNTCSSYLSYS